MRIVVDPPNPFRPPIVNSPRHGLDGTLDQPKVNMTSKGVEATKALEAQA